MLFYLLASEQLATWEHRVGSYPLPDWLAAAPSEQALARAASRDRRIHAQCAAESRDIG